jgi:hypothetical protein
MLVHAFKAFFSDGTLIKLVNNKNEPEGGFYKHVCLKYSGLGIFSTLYSEHLNTKQLKTSGNWTC